MENMTYEEIKMELTAMRKEFQEAKRLIMEAACYGVTAAVREEPTYKDSDYA